MLEFRGTTIIGVKRDGKIVLAGDGQVTAGEHTIFKGNAKKTEAEEQAASLRQQILNLKNS